MNYENKLKLTKRKTETSGFVYSVNYKRNFSKRRSLLYSKIEIFLVFRNPIYVFLRRKTYTEDLNGYRNKQILWLYYYVSVCMGTIVSSHFDDYVRKIIEDFGPQIVQRSTSRLRITSRTDDETKPIRP